MFRVFDRYLLKEVINGWLAVTLFLWLILVSNRLVDYLGDAVSGDIPGNLIFKLIGLKMVWYLVHVVPFALALGVVLALGRLYRNNEMTVMSACGVGSWNIYKPRSTSSRMPFGVVMQSLEPMDPRPTTTELTPLPSLSTFIRTNHWWLHPSVATCLT